MVESEVGSESHQRTPGPELSPDRESTRTESGQEELEGHDATTYVPFHYSFERIHTGRASETIAQIEHLTLNILEQIVAPLKKPRRDLGSVVGTQSHHQIDGKVEIQIADRRKDKTGG